MSGKEVQKWADKAMFKAEEIDASAGPQVKLLSCNSDPLGTIAAAALMYEGKSVDSLAKITDEQRRYYLEQVQRSVLEAPLEFVNFHFIISGVTRGFTHQMVRQRTATYTQESTRFAVKETVPVALPPSLIGTVSEEAYWAEEERTAVGGWTRDHLKDFGEERQYIERNAGQAQLWRVKWDSTVDNLEMAYNELVATGMPAEDARGLLPTNLLTRINYNTSLRGLKDHAGVRLCTQAQYEWRQVWAQIIPAIREYGNTASYDDGVYGQLKSSRWQFEALADVFKPICYYKGRCQFMSNVDRHCTIRDRVEAFADLGIPSTKWDSPYAKSDVGVDPITSDEWMAEGTARISQ
jgi:flavin-dependent thymidylate synthase